MRRILSVFVILLLVLNLIFFALGRVSVLLFWLIIALAALFAHLLKKSR